MEIEEVKRAVSDIIQQELTGKEFKVFFFGSRITGTNSKTSDLDVGIEGPGPVPGTVLRTIKSRCEALPTLFTIDVVDFYYVQSNFKEVAKSKIEAIIE